MGAVGEFVIEPTSEAISVPTSHTSGCVALVLPFAIDNHPLCVAVAEHDTPRRFLPQLRPSPAVTRGSVFRESSRGRGGDVL
jgi:hypothetical protein